MLRLNNAHASMDIVFGLIAFFPLQRYDISPKPPRKLVYKKFTFSLVSNKQFTKNLQIGLTAHHGLDFQKSEKRTVQIVKTRFSYDLKQIV